MGLGMVVGDGGHGVEPGGRLAGAGIESGVFVRDDSVRR